MFEIPSINNKYKFRLQALGKLLAAIALIT